MSEDKVNLTVEEAISCLNDVDSVHTFTNPAGMLLGCDCSRKSIIKTFKSNPDSIEIGGKMCRSMKHGLVVWCSDSSGPMFIEANEERLAAIENEKTKLHFNMRKETINNQPCTVDALLEGYTIEQKPSSNVEYFGDNGQNVFVQFKSGGSYLYLNVIAEDIEAMKQAESIGKFIPTIAKKYQYTKVDHRLVEVVKEEVA